MPPGADTALAAGGPLRWQLLHELDACTATGIERPFFKILTATLFYVLGYADYGKAT